MFDDVAKEFIFEYLSKDYIDGITWSGGDPLHPSNIAAVTKISKEIKEIYPTKSIWLYSGYEYEWVKKYQTEVLQYIDVLVDGKFVQDLADVNYRWAGSRNQKIIDIKESLKCGKVVLLSLV